MTPQQLLLPGSLLLIVLLGQSERTEPASVQYFPVVPHQPYPDCNVHSKMGTAWFQVSPALGLEERFIFCGHYYYFYRASFAGIDNSNPDEILKVWCFWPVHFALLQTLSPAYTNWVSGGNEPGADGAQCTRDEQDTPADASWSGESLGQMMVMRPNAKWVAPNIIVISPTGEYASIEWLDEWLTALEAVVGSPAPLDCLGFHLYHGNEVSPWTKIEWVSAWLDGRGYEALPLCVTEFGVYASEADPYQFMYDKIEACLSHWRTIMCLPFTIRGVNEAMNWIVEGQGVFGIHVTESGKALFDSTRSNQGLD